MTLQLSCLTWTSRRSLSKWIIRPCGEPGVLTRRFRHLFLGATSNAGQICFNVKRLYVHEDIYDAFRDEIVALAKVATIGDPFDLDTTIGPVQNQRLYDKLKYVPSAHEIVGGSLWIYHVLTRDLMADSKDKGYKIAFEGEVPASSEKSKGYFIPVTVLDNPPEDARAVREEREWSVPVYVCNPLTTGLRTRVWPYYSYHEVAGRRRSSSARKYVFRMT